MLAVAGCVSTGQEFNAAPTATVTSAEPLPTPINESLIEAQEAEFDCLRKNIYFEAGNQPMKYKQAVAFVTLHRTKAKHFPSTICGVVKQARLDRKGKPIRAQCQFSWYCDGKDDVPNLKNKLEREAWEESTIAARDVLNGRVKDFLPWTASHYHANYCSPGWSKSSRFALVKRLGTHLFYSDLKLKLKAA
jgi:spore germination cell wall hydrolase CwlJ-like protein